MAKINIGATKRALSTFSQSYADIGDLMSGINGDYFNGIDKYWDTQTAYKYFSSMAKSLNGTIKSMNSAFKEACDCIQKAADNIASDEVEKKLEQFLLVAFQIFQLNGKEKMMDIIFL